MGGGFFEALTMGLDYPIIVTSPLPALKQGQMTGVGLEC